MTMLTSFGTEPFAFAFAFPTGVVDLMLATLAIAGLGVAVSSLSAALRARTGKSERGPAQFLCSVARQAARA